jgi:hypothetical protein
MFIFLSFKGIWFILHRVGLEDVTVFRKLLLQIRHVLAPHPVLFFGVTSVNFDPVSNNNEFH